MSEPKKVDRRKFIYAGLGAVALIAIGAAAYVAMNPPVVTQTVTTSTTVPTTSVVTTTSVSTTTATTTATTTVAPAKINVMAQSALAEMYGPIISDFMTKTGIPVEVAPVPHQEMKAKGLVELSAGSPTFDVYTCEATWTPDWSAYLEDLYPYAVRDKLDLSLFNPSMLGLFSPPFFGTYKQGNPLYAIPFAIGQRMLAYRYDLFQSEGIKIPETIPEFLDVAQKLNKEGIAGYGLQGGTTVYTVSEWVHFLWAFGGELLVQEGGKWRVTVNEDPGIRALQFWTDLRNKYNVVQASAPQDAYAEILVHAQQGKIAMGTFYSGWINAANDPTVSKVPGAWRLARFPYHPDYVKPDHPRSWMSGWSLALNKASKNKDNGWELVKYFVKPEIQLRLGLEYATGGEPTLSSVFTNPDYLKKNPSAPEILKNAEIIRTLTMPLHPKVEEIRDILRVELNNALLQKKTPKEALDDGAKSIKERLGL
jgi:multiple sugar transport system substrate-binding protein